MIVLRLHRSTSAPAKGPMRICGSKAARLVNASMVAEPVVFVSHQTIANWTSWLPSRDTAWPVHMVKNDLIQT